MWPAGVTGLVWLCLQDAQELMRQRLRRMLRHHTCPLLLVEVPPAAAPGAVPPPGKPWRLLDINVAAGNLLGEYAMPPRSP